MQATVGQDQGLSRRMERLDRLLDEIQTSADPAMRARVQEIVRTLMDFHSGALERMLEILADRGTDGQAQIDEIAGDPVVSPMLALYGLHPLSARARVLAAIESVRPQLAQHGGSVELTAMDEAGAITLRLNGNCHGCPSSRSTLKGLIEKAIFAAAPEVTEIRVEQEESQAEPGEAGFLPVSAVRFNGCPIPAAT